MKLYKPSAYNRNFTVLGELESHTKIPEKYYPAQSLLGLRRGLPVFLLTVGIRGSGHSVRGGEWPFQKYGSRKIVVKILGSRSLDFCADVSVSES